MKASPWSADFCEREYNVRAAVPDHGAVFARWAEQSRAVRRSRPALLDLAYGDSAAERLDLFPTHVAHAPLLTFIHGGYWRALDKSDFSWLAPTYTARGINVAVVNYGLLPATPLADIVRQMLRAHAWLYRHADAYAYDRDAIYASGHSAGGHLTAMMMLARWPQWEPDLPVGLVKAGIAVSGLFELEPLRHTPFIRADLGLDAAAARKLSPAAMPAPAGTRLLTCVGGEESAEFHRQSQSLAAAWPQARVERVNAPGRNHLTVCDALAESAHPLHETAAALVLGR